MREMRQDGDKFLVPEDIIEEILENSYLCDDHYISTFSQRSLLHLHEVTEKENTAWLTALLVALAAQGRHSEANVAYQELLKTETTNYELIFLVTARFSLFMSVDIPMNTSRETKEKAILGAAVGNNLEMIEKLHTDGVSLSTAQRHTTLANTAATCGNLSITKYLHDNGVDLCEAHEYQQGLYADTPLYRAASEGHFDVAHFLLSIGARPDKASQWRIPPISNYTPFEVALIFGKINILKLFLEHTPGLATASSLFVIMQNKKDDRNKVVEYLVQEVGLDINSMDNGGRTAAHWAALKPDLVLAKLLHSLKANFTIRDHSGQTPQEVAESHGHQEITVWFAQNAWVPDVPTAAYKAALASAIVASRHDVHIRKVLCATESVTLKKEDIEIRWFHEQMDKKITSQYIKMYDADTLRQWRDILGSETDNVMLKTLELESAALPNFTLTEEEEQRLPKTSQLAKEIMLPLPGRFAKIMVHFIGERELEILTAFARTELGRRIFAQKHHDEDYLIVTFSISLRRP